jgi:5-methylcytosine-specific restriction endonuclease McrA
MNDSYYTLDPAHTDPQRVAKERKKAQELKKSEWWRTKLNQGLCHYCGKKFLPSELTMDHVIPIARGGESIKSNVVVACRPCNQSKKLATPIDDLFAQIAQEKESK